MRILITGGTGFVGGALKQFLLNQGHEVVILSRSGGDFQWDVSYGYIDPAAFEGVDAVVHLAGAGIADERWSATRKRELINSRVRSTAVLYQALSTIPHSIKTVVSASAIGFYGADTGEQECLETSPVGLDFLADCTKQWEEAVDQIATLGIRHAKVRIGLVMGANGGIFPVISKPIRYYVGANLGSGKQWQSWIHINDLVRIFNELLINSSLSGVFNGVAPEPIRAGAMNKQIAKALHRPFFLPSIPGFLLRLVLGEMACLVLGGSRVSSAKIEKDASFSFTFVRFEEALKEIVHV
ncbi:TIGR01777 family oxidoreductase [Aquirufa sp. HETE-40SA]